MIKSREVPRLTHLGISQERPLAPVAGQRARVSLQVHDAALPGRAGERRPESHPLGERVVGRRLLAGVAAVEQVLVDAALGRAGQLHLGLDQLPVAVRPARAASARVLDLAAGPPVLDHRVPVHAVAPGDVGEVGLGDRLPVHVELSHDVPFQSGLLPSGDVGSLHPAAPEAP